MPDGEETAWGSEVDWGGGGPTAPSVVSWVMGDLDLHSSSDSGEQYSTDVRDARRVTVPDSDSERDTVRTAVGALVRM